MASSDLPGMSDYERSAWERLVAETAGKQSQQPGRLSRWSETATSQAKGVAGKAKNVVVEHVPGADKAILVLDATMQKAPAGLHTAFVERGLNSVSPATIFASFASEGASVTPYEDVRKLDLKLCGRSVPRRREKYIAMAAGQGAATGSSSPRLVARIEVCFGAQQQSALSVATLRR